MVQILRGVRGVADPDEALRRRLIKFAELKRANARQARRRRRFDDPTDDKIDTTFAMWGDDGRGEVASTLEVRPEARTGRPVQIIGRKSGSDAGRSTSLDLPWVSLRGKSGREMARKIRDASWLANDSADDEPAEPCWLCGRLLGKTVDRFHPIPKSRGGRDTVPVHPICRETIDAHFSASELVRHAENGIPLTDNETVARFVKWVANKPADFHSATKAGR